jgi:PmbA protein
MPSHTLNISDVLTILQGLPGLKAWELIRQKKKSYQKYLIFDRPEAQRVVESQRITVVLYQTREEQGRTVLGEAVVVLAEGDPMEDKLVKGLEMASLVANPPFDLPEKGLTYPEVTTFDPVVRHDPFGTLKRVEEDLLRPHLPGVKRSSLEIFVEDRELLLLNSNGLNLEERRSEYTVDFVLLAEGGPSAGGEGEGLLQAVFYEDLRLEEMLERYARYADEAGRARLPQTGFFPVVFAEEALDTLFSFFCLQASGPARFQNWSRLKIGAPVIEGLLGEPLTLVSDPSLPGGWKSRAFDGNGLPLRRVEVIKENLFRTPMNSKRYADYLGEEATGDFANVEVACGTYPLDDLLTDGPVFLILRFSHFEPHPVSGAFSGEIRTGYFLRKGEKIPIKGGSVSGSMVEAFRRARFSREETRRKAYRGPAAVRLEPLALAGA